MHVLRNRLGWGLVVAAGVSLVVTGPAATPSRWPVPVDLSSPQGQALLRSALPKTGVIDARTGEITALYPGFVTPPPTADEPVRPPWVAGSHANGG
jgi:hypothetical protein